MLTGVKCYLKPVNVYFTDYNIMQRESPTELNFEALQLQYVKNINRQSSQSR